MFVTPITLHSKLDPSVNAILEGGFETRFVTRGEGPDVEVLIYLSSFKGCDRACRMCWLTQQGQTEMIPATLEDFLNQAEVSLTHAKEYLDKNGLGVKKVHYNFMARGEPMLNPLIKTNFDSLGDALLSAAAEKLDLDGQEVLFKISTIMTDIYVRDKNGVIVGGMSELPFHRYKPEIYYSVYCLDKDFRKRWLPKAEEPKEAMRLLSNYQLKGGKVRLHGAFIFAENDDIDQVMDLVKLVEFFGIVKKFNIVRYNSPDPTKSTETTEEQLESIKAFLESKGFEVQMVPRVGNDISASCGMFIA